MLRGVLPTVSLLLLVVATVGGAVKGEGATGETIPEFFDDSLNIYVLIIGAGIILVCALIAFLIFKLKGRSAAF